MKSCETNRPSAMSAESSASRKEHRINDLVPGKPTAALVGNSRGRALLLSAKPLTTIN